MKAIFLMVAGAAIAMSSCSQDIPASKVPSVVQNAVQTKFGNADKVEWEKKDNVYEAEFDLNNIEHKVRISAEGKLIMYKTDIQPNQLPAPVSTAITGQHAGYAVDDADKLEKDGVTYYQVELEAKAKKDKRLVFTADGKLAESIPYML